MKTYSGVLRGLKYYIVVFCLLISACQQSLSENPAQKPAATSQSVAATTPIDSGTNEITREETPLVNATPDQYANQKVDCSYDYTYKRYVSAFSADGKRLVCVKEQTMVMYQIDPLEKVWETNLEREATSITFSPDGVFLGVASKLKLFPENLDLYDANNGKLIKKFDNPEGNWYKAIAFSPDSRFIAVNGIKNGNGVFVLDRESGETVCRYGEAGTMGVAFSADGNRLLVPLSGRSVILAPTTCKPMTTQFNTELDTDVMLVASTGDWVIGTSEAVSLVRDDKVVSVCKEVGIPINGMKPYAISSDGKWFAAAYGDTIKICDLSTGESKKITDYKMGNVLDIAFTPQGELVGITPTVVKFWQFDFK